MASGEGGRSAAGGPGGGAAAAAAASVDSRELVVPLPRAGLLHLCVEYPGYVADEQRVLDTLGGLPGIARQLQVRALARLLAEEAEGRLGPLAAGGSGWRAALIVLLLALALPPFFLPSACLPACRRTPSRCPCGCAPRT
jgi:hypothetical protein